MFGNIGEPRTFIMCFVLLIFVAIWSETNRKPSFEGETNPV